MTCERKWGDALVLWIARGFDVGRAPVAPGTFGSVVGLAWTLVLVATRSVWWYGLGVAAGLTLSVVVCGLAERILRERDPGSVVLDEITALPLCFAGWI
ncbi:MAG TPA: phosphatidylglycerophosphatase A, partial [Verrucomicrobiota bacterium]|nr:phosphatidylglycerophosphatase A [Verrucomicrobiota bacterium]